MHNSWVLIAGIVAFLMAIFALWEVQSEQGKCESAVFGRFLGRCVCMPAG